MLLPSYANSSLSTWDGVTLKGCRNVHGDSTYFVHGDSTYLQLFNIKEAGHSKKAYIFLSTLKKPRTKFRFLL